MSRVDQEACEALFEDVVDRLPVNPRALHRHVGHTVRLQPVSEREEFTRRRAEGAGMLSALSRGHRHPHAGRHGFLVHVQPTASFDYSLHDAASWRCVAGEVLELALAAAQRAADLRSEWARPTRQNNIATNCPRHVKPRAWRSACVRFTRTWNSVRGNSLRSWLSAWSEASRPFSSVGGPRGERAEWLGLALVGLAR
jgi:hypothetical protein